MATFLALLFMAAMPCPGDEKEKAARLYEEASGLHLKALATETDRQAVLKKAEDLLREAVAMDPGHAPFHVALAKVIWDRGDQLAAFRLSQSLTSKFPKSPDVRILEGDLNWYCSQWKKALKAYEKAIELEADERALILRIGSAHGKLGDYEAAFQCYDRALELGLPKAECYFKLGLCYEATGRFDMALGYYLKSQEEDGRYLPVLKQLVVFHKKSAVTGTPDLEKALEYSLKAYELAPEDLDVIKELMDILNEMKRYEDALEILDKILEKYPDNPDLLKFKKVLERLVK
jgi:tetratricopeptide (TPR) repeat protein